jgi:hypothetical protein
VLAPRLSGDSFQIAERFRRKQHFVVPARIGLRAMTGGNLFGRFRVVLACGPLADGQRAEHGPGSQRHFGHGVFKQHRN